MATQSKVFSDNLLLKIACLFLLLLKKHIVHTQFLVTVALCYLNNETILRFH